MPGFSTFEARPLAVFSASAGAAFTSEGALGSGGGAAGWARGRRAFFSSGGAAGLSGALLQAAPSATSVNTRAGRRRTVVRMAGIKHHYLSTRGKSTA